MKSKLVPAVLVLVCLGLGTGWFLNSKKAEETRIQMEGQQSALSNDLVATTGKLTEQVRVNATLETNLSQRIEDLNTVSNKWVATSGELTRTSAEAAKAAAAAKTEIERRDKQISDLEGEKDDLTKKMGELTGQIGGLENQIKITERKLAASEGDREALKKELKRLIAEKTDLEKKFNDLAILRDQVRKLGYDDRIYGTMRLALQHGIRPTHLAQGAAAAVLSLLEQWDSLGQAVSGLPLPPGPLSLESVGQLLRALWSAKAGPEAATLIDLTWVAVMSLQVKTAHA